MMRRIRVFLQGRRHALLAFFVLLSGALAWAGYRYWHKPPPYQGVSRIQIDLRAPEMLLSTRNLAALPKDIAAAPALQGLVDEQLVFHYEEDEARLSLEGSLRRLAYEHPLELHDRFLATLLAAPAEIGLWRSSKGRPEYFVAALERGALGAMTQALAKIALNDRQLQQAGVFSIGGRDLPLYTLDYGGGRSLGFVGAGERWVFLSDPGMVLDAEGKLTGDAARVLGDLLHGRHPWQDRLPQPASARHSLAIGGEALTLGYARFLPALAGVRFEHDGERWHTGLRLDRKSLPDNYDSNAGLTALWRALPNSPALCAALPINWQAVAEPLGELLHKDAALQPTLEALDPLVAVCWYAESRLSAPLFVATAGRALPPESSRLLAALAEKAWSAPALPQEGASGEGAHQGESERYAATVPSRHGLRQGRAQDRAFQPAIARHSQRIMFSPDERHVAAALAVAARQAVAIGDAPALQRPAWLLYDPKRLAQLTRSEVQDVLPADEESFFREVARQRLWPRLEAWGNLPSAGLFAGAAGKDGFIVLEAGALGAPSPTTR